jgi:hypothetical protein
VAAWFVACCYAVLLAGLMGSIFVMVWILYWEATLRKWLRSLSRCVVLTSLELFIVFNKHILRE